ncbi:DUF3576 domain-containing protein [Candidatus Finniella inopinata]|uniref:DUF3576 domain-containing protein n=2 Tax=Candidatus Finniella inopinata TaxID=1696036 RepID=A0A4Q7DGQ0_9PROT|nr:DUF3576 domain-containing protein [Candidatus Finniella inopinata]
MAMSFLVTACSDMNPQSKPPEDKADKRKLGFGSIAGEDLLTFGGPKKNTGSGPTLNVNQYLWKASLETLEFMPLVSADSVGGVILTDWHSTAAAPNERFKVSVYIHGSVLRADALKVIVHKQVRGVNGQWVQSNTSMQVATDLENIILSKARALRVKDTKPS